MSEDDPRGNNSFTERVGEIEKLLDEAELISTSTIALSKELLELGRHYENLPKALALWINFLSRNADKYPADVIGELTKLAPVLNELGNETFMAPVDEVLAIAYLRRGRAGDMVRTHQHGYKATKGYKRTSSDPSVSMEAIRFALRWNSTPAATEPDFAVHGVSDLASWLESQTKLALSDLGTPFGKFVTNDRKFYRAAKERVGMLHRRLTAKLAKPDNYLMEADPGSGKSLFVEEFKDQLQKALGQGHDVRFLKRNLSAYQSVDQAFNDIVLDVLTALAACRDVLLFIDEVDTQINDNHIFQKLIAPMNGDPFFFQGKSVNLSKQNLIGFYALSGGREEVAKATKFSDFLSRIPEAHRITLPRFNDPIERLYRAIGMLLRGQHEMPLVCCAEAQALLYVAVNAWKSSRELEQAIELAKLRMEEGSRVFALAHIATHEEILAHEKGGVKIYEAANHAIELGE